MACSGVSGVGFGLVSADLLEVALLWRQWWVGSDAEVCRSGSGRPGRVEPIGARPLGCDDRAESLLMFSSYSWVMWTCDCDDSWTASDMVALVPPWRETKALNQARASM